MGKEFEDVAKKLGIEDGEQEIEKPEKIKHEIKHSENHENNMKADYKRMRDDINKHLDSCSHVADIMEQSIEESSIDDKFMARKVETFAQLVKAGSELRKELLNLHKITIDILEDDNEEEENSNTNKTSSKDIRKMLKEMKKEEFDFVAGGEK